MKNRNVLLLACCIAAVACSRNDAPREPGEGPGAPATATTATGAATPASAVAQLESRSGSTATGQLQFTMSDGGVSITGELAGLTPGTEHGFHVHETGDCSAADASSAGGHFNPHNAQHGPPTVAQNERHLGDMPNVVADENGRSAITAAIPGATLRDGGVNDLIGKAVVVHAQRDDYVTQPSGDAGGRITCGVIR